MAEDLGERVVRIEERQDVHGKTLDRLERNSERNTENLNRVIWLLGTLGTLLIASQTGLLEALGKLLALAK